MLLSWAGAVRVGREAEELTGNCDGNEVWSACIVSSEEEGRVTCGAVVEPPYESTRLEQPTMADEYGGYPYTDDQRGYRQLPVDSAYGYEGEMEEPWRPIAEGLLYGH